MGIDMIIEFELLVSKSIERELDQSRLDTVSLSLVENLPWSSVVLGIFDFIVEFSLLSLEILLQICFEPGFSSDLSYDPNSFGKVFHMLAINNGSKLGAGGSSVVFVLDVDIASFFWVISK